MRKLSWAILITMFSFSCKKESENTPDLPAAPFNKLFGGSDDETAYSVIETNGAYVITGFARSNNGDVSGNKGMHDMWVVKLNKQGGLIWQKTFGGSGFDQGYSLVSSADAGYVVAGSTRSNDGDVTGNHGGTDVWMIKLDIDGNIQWTKLLGGTADDGAYSLTHSADGGFVMAGYTSSNDGDVSGNHGGQDIWVVKVNAQGDVVWNKTLGGQGYELAQSITPSVDGGYLVVGDTHSSNDGDVSGNHGDVDAWVVKLDGNGNKLWQKALGGKGYDVPRSVAAKMDGSFILTGATRTVTPDDDLDTWVVKLNPDGSIAWRKAIGGTGDELGYSVAFSTDGGYVITGETYSNDGALTGSNGGGDAWVIKLDNNGNTKWHKLMGGSDLEIGRCIIPKAAGGYLMVGAAKSNDGLLSGNHGGVYTGDAWVVTVDEP